jgi:hypothetical protein
LNDFIVAVEFKHHVLDLTSQTMTDTTGCHRLEPMTVNIGTTIDSPEIDKIVLKK